MDKKYGYKDRTGDTLTVSRLLSGETRVFTGSRPAYLPREDGTLAEATAAMLDAGGTLPVFPTPEDALPDNPQTCEARAMELLQHAAKLRKAPRVTLVPGQVGTGVTTLGHPVRGYVDERPYLCVVTENGGCGGSLEAYDLAEWHPLEAADPGQDDTPAYPPADAPLRVENEDPEPPRGAVYRDGDGDPRVFTGQGWTCVGFRFITERPYVGNHCGPWILVTDQAEAERCRAAAMAQAAQVSQ